jgi:hypothetical protein
VYACWLPLLRNCHVRHARARATLSAAAPRRLGGGGPAVRRQRSCGAKRGVAEGASQRNVRLFATMLLDFAQHTLQQTSQSRTASGTAPRD